jgi:putative membrane protein
MAIESTIPRWIRPYLDEAKIKSIDAAITAAECKTSGEIVPLVVKSSSALGHVPTITFCAFLIAMLVFHLEQVQRVHIYDTSFWPFVNLIFAALLAFIFSRLSFVQRLLVSEQDRITQVKHRAELEFYRLGITETEGATGILIFVSLLEHRIEVMADKKISIMLPPETWNGVVEQVLAGIRSGDLSKGLCNAIETCGNILADKFPIKSGDRNELKDHVIWKV